MGALAGILGDGSQDDANAMVSRMPHRVGESSCWQPAPRVVFASGSWGGAPSRSASGDLMLDGIIENAPELRTMLGAGPHTSEPDLLERLLAERGCDGLSEVRGGFALAWHSGGRVLLACDQARFKSLYWARLDDRIAFASEYKGLLALPDVPTTLDRRAVAYFLATGRSLSDRSFLAVAESAGPGEAVWLSEAGISRKRYWRPRPGPAYRDRRTAEKAVRDSLTSVLERQSRPYDRIGVTLGTGLDSAALIAALHLVRPDVTLESFVIGHGPDDPEIVGARAVADHVGSRHHEVFYDPEGLPEDLWELVWLMEDCGGRDEGLLQFSVLRYAGSRVPVVMGGHGADRLYGGMPRHRLVRLAEVAGVFRKPIADLFLSTQTRVAPANLLARIPYQLKYGRADVPSPCAMPDLTPADLGWSADLNRHLADTMMDSPTYGYIEPIHERVRARFHTPFLDPDMIDVAMRVPSRHKIDLRAAKIVLRGAVNRMLPPSVVGRGKAIQNLVRDTRVDEQLVGLANRLLPDGAATDLGLFDGPGYAAARSEWESVPLRAPVRWRLWPMLCLEMWVRQFVLERGVARTRDAVPPPMLVG